MIDAAVQSPPQPAVAYLRRSTDKQEQSLGDQRAETKRWAGSNGYNIIAEYVDDAVSGTNAKSRPAFQRMIADAKKGDFAAVIVWNSDRFSRGDLCETEHHLFLLREAGVSVYSVTEDYLSQAGIGADVLRAVKQFQNRQFSVSLSQNTLRGQISSVQKSSDPGRLTPYGYDREIVGPDGTVMYCIRFHESGVRETFDRNGQPMAKYAAGDSLRKPDKQCTAQLVLSSEERVGVVRDIFDMCVAGRGFKTIADELNRRCVLSPKGKLWQHTTIKTMIENPVYRGDIVWNRRTESKFYEVINGRADKMKPAIRSGSVRHVAQDDWIVVEKAVPPIVDRATWDKAQVAAQARAERAGRQGSDRDRWLLSGMLCCADCGSPYWGLHKTKGKKAGRKLIRTPYYICSGRCRSGKSVYPTSAHVRADLLEEFVLAELRNAVLGDDVGVGAAVDRFVAQVLGQSGAAERAAQAKAWKKEIDGIDRQVNALLTGLDPANIALVNVRLTQLRHRKEHLARQIRAGESDSHGTDEKAVRKFAAERIGLLVETSRGRRDEATRRMIASYINKIVIEPATKTGYVVMNAGVAGAAGTAQPQKPDDPPKGGSQVSVIAGAP